MPPSNDNFADAEVITGDEGSVSGTTVGATAEVSEPIPSEGPGDGPWNSIWYSWTAPRTTHANFDTEGSDEDSDTVLAVYTGSDLASLVEVVSDDESGFGSGVSKLFFNAVEGVTYYIQLSAYDAETYSTGPVVLNWYPFTPENMDGCFDFWLADDLVPNEGATDGSSVNFYGGRNAHFLAQATPGSRPTYRASGVGSQPGIDFDGTDDLLRYVGSLPVATSGSVFAVVQFDAFDPGSGGFDVIWASADEDSSTRYLYCNIDTQKLQLIQKNNDTPTDVAWGDTSLSTSTPYLIEISSTGTAYSMRINDVEQTLSFPLGSNTGDWFGDTSNRDNITLGGLQTSGGSTGFLSGRIALLLILEQVISDEDRNSFHGWLNDKYGFDLDYTPPPPLGTDQTQWVGFIPIA